MACQSTFSLFKKADMEGYLEKLGSGITSKWKAGRTKLWCELYGTQLHLFKDNKRSSAGIQQLDMNQVHMVRKASADKSGMQFEILYKTKCQTFCASSLDECNTWIKHLQRAMTLKDQESASAQLDARCESVGDYEIVDILPEDASKVPQFVLKQSTASESDSGYAEVEFCSASSETDSNRIPASPAHAKAQQLLQTEEDGYSSVDVVLRNGSGQPVLQELGASLASCPVNPTPEGDNIKDAYAKVMKPAHNTNTSQIHGDNKEGGYAKVMKPKRVSEPSQPVTTRMEPEGYTEDSYGYAEVNTSSSPTLPSAAESGENSAEGLRTVGDGASDDTSDEDDVYVNIISKESPDSIPKFPHPLKEADTQPLAVLQEFLSNNRKVCRRSFMDVSMGDDPIGDMKKLLVELQL